MSRALSLDHEQDAHATLKLMISRDIILKESRRPDAETKNYEYQKRQFSNVERQP